MSASHFVVVWFVYPGEIALECCRRLIQQLVSFLTTKLFDIHRVSTPSSCEYGHKPFQRITHFNK